MNRFVFIVPLIFLSFLFFTYDYTQQLSSQEKLDTPAPEKFSSTSQQQLVSDYFIEVEFLPDEKLILSKQKVLWRNLTDQSTNELQFHLYANALANNKTEFAKHFNLTEEEQTKIHFDKIVVNGEKQNLEYFQSEIENLYDSTVAKINLFESLQPGDSVLVEFEYQLKIPLSVKRFGYASGTEFYFIAQWFPKLGVFENGEWTCSQYHANTEFYSDFSNYNVVITTPTNFQIGATGKLVDENIIDTKRNLRFEAENVIDFAWTASPEFNRITKSYTSKFNKRIEIEFLTQPENDELIERKLKAAFNAIEYLENNIGEFPYPRITLVDVPRTSNIGGMEYPQIVTYFTPLYTPIEIQKPESTIIHEIIHQYFYAAVSSNEVYSAWLDEGLTTYVEEKILDYYYGEPELYFSFIDYYPIFGIKFLSIGEIPLIYTLRELNYHHYAHSLNTYYMNSGLGSLQDTSYKYPTKLSYAVNAYSKPNLILHTLEGYLGETEVMNILSAYYEENRFSLVSERNFINQLMKYKNGDLSWFVTEFINENKRFDYRLTSIEQTSEKHYKVFVERLETGITPIEIYLYTQNDTLQFTWNGEERWKEFEVESRALILSGEIDPQRKNKFDLNFANNSYTVEPKYWGSLSIVIRWFFWVQNAMLIFGSVG